MEGAILTGIRKIVVATRNPGKLREIQEILQDLPIELVSLAAYPGAPEVAEDGATYLENARKKARAISEYCGEWALADDSGLEVEALGGRPGVHSARYAGEDASDEENCRKLLAEMASVQSREARFRCALSLSYFSGKEFSAEGELLGEIVSRRRGENGFGYDPLFYFPPLNKTLAEITLEEKNKISHRTHALGKMKKILKELTA